MIESLENIIQVVFKKLGYNTKYAKVSYSKIPEDYDFQINSVFYLSKELKINPKDIGENIVEGLKNHNIFEKVDFCLPGFINIRVTDKFLNEHLNNVGKRKKPGSAKCYFLDYGGPNIAKPLHVGHLRPAIIGESLKRILKYTGNKVISDVHLGDYGLQIGQVIYGLKKENIEAEKIDLNILNKLYPLISSLCKEDESVLSACQEITLKLQNGDEEFMKYWQKIYEVSLSDIKNMYNFLGVSFDLWLGEKDSYEHIEDLMKFLNSKNIVKTDEGAKVIEIKEITDNKEMPPLILQKSNGAYLYATTDLAAIYDRIKKYNPNYILYFTDYRQTLHFEQVFRACYKADMTPNTILEHNYNGAVNGPDGKPFKTRSGDTLKLEELINNVKTNFISKKDTNEYMSQEDINIIVNAIIKYADLQNNREKNYIFDINKFSETTGKTGPYILYTAIRIRKILKDNLYNKKQITGKSLNIEERNLKVALLGKSDTVEKAADERMPHYISEYVYDLSTKINSFYQLNNVSNELDELRKAEWLNLLELSYKTLEEMLKLLVIEIPSKM